MAVANLLLVLAMVGTSAFGALALPPDGQLPINFAAGPRLNWMPKAIVLVLWPAMGVVSYLTTGLSAALGAMSARSRIGLTIALGLMLLVQAGSLLLALKRRGRP